MKQTDFDELLAAVIEGEASGAQLAEFERMLKENPEFAAEAKALIALHGELSIAHESEFQTEQWLQGTNLAIEKAEEDAFSDKVVSEIKHKRWLNKALAIAALVLVGFATVFFLKPFGADPVEPQLATVAKLKRIEAVQWKSDAQVAGTTITAGQSLQFESGLLELDLDGRGSLIIEGPAHVDFTNAMEAVLHRGSLVMRATEKGHGYTVKTPKGKVIDLGTEFAVTVGDDDTVETHVIDGSVQAVASNGESVTLLKNDAVRFVKEGNKEISADVGRFYTALPPQHTEKKHIHWSFDEGKGSSAKAVGELGKNKDLKFQTVNNGSMPQWIDGVVSKAIKLDGQGAFAQSNYQGIQGGKARTVCFWLKVPKDFSTKQGFGIISWGNPSKKGATWQISINPNANDGAIGRLRLGLQGGQIIGSTDLRDGKWHHISVVLYGGSQPNVGTHALLYIDGEKEKVSRAALQEVRTTSNDNDYGVWVGRNVTYRTDAKPHFNGKFFRGEIDELYIFDAALSPEEIRHRMKR